MSERIEKLIRDYRKLKMEQECLLRQICDFRGFSEQDMIDVLYFTQPEGERVQTSGMSDKTAKVALNYKSKMAKINEEWYDHLEDEYMKLTEELRFFESAVMSLPGIMGDVMRDIVMKGKTWTECADQYFINRRTVGKYRSKAIDALQKLYENREAQMDSYMLN